MIKFAYTILYVQDIEKSISFYENAFGFERTFVSPGGEYGELSTGNTTLSFASIAQASSNLKNGFTQSDINSKPQAMEIGFTTVDVSAYFKKALAAGATKESDPEVKPHGQTVAYVRDPDGFLVEICTPMD